MHVEQRLTVVREVLAELAIIPKSRQMLEDTVVQYDAELSSDDEKALSDDYEQLVSDAAAEGVYLSPGHVYALSQVLRRPIVVYHEHPGPIPGTGTSMEGIYLPLSWKPDEVYCCKDPLTILFTVPEGKAGGHFTALVFEGEYGGEHESGAIAKRASAETFGERSSRGGGACNHRPCGFTEVGGQQGHHDAGQAEEPEWVRASASQQRARGGLVEEFLMQFFRLARAHEPAVLHFGPPVHPLRVELPRELDELVCAIL